MKKENQEKKQPEKGIILTVNGRRVYVNTSIKKDWPVELSIDGVTVYLSSMQAKMADDSDPHTPPPPPHL